MKNETKFNIYIGLKTENMKTNLNEKTTINLISEKLLSLNILGYNIEKIKGYWNGKPENSLKISFINTYEITTRNIILLIEELKKELNQESILLEKEKVIYNFI